MPEQAGREEKTKRERTPIPVGVPVLRPEHAAPYCGLSEPSLARLRFDGTGPAFVQLGARAIGYRIADLDAWLASRPRFRSTTQRDVATAAA